jgi:hypothetical protein
MTEAEASATIPLGIEPSAQPVSLNQRTAEETIADRASTTSSPLSRDAASPSEGDDDAIIAGS